MNRIFFEDTDFDNPELLEIKSTILVDENSKLYWDARRIRIENIDEDQNLFDRLDHNHLPRELHFVNLNKDRLVEYLIATVLDDYHYSIKYVGVNPIIEEKKLENDLLETAMRDDLTKSDSESAHFMNLKSSLDASCWLLIVKGEERKIIYDITQKFPIEYPSESVVFSWINNGYTLYIRNPIEKIFKYWKEDEKLMMDIPHT